MVAIPVSVADQAGKLAFFVGVGLLILGAISLSELGSILSAVSLFAGAQLLFLGLFSMLGLFSCGVRSLGGFGMILICIGIAFVAFSLVAFQFLAIVRVDTQTIIFKGEIIGYRQVPITERPYSWASEISIWLGVVSMVGGIVTRVTSLWK